MEKFRAACVQIAANDVSEYLDGERKILKGIDEAYRKGVDFVIFPECSYPSYYIGNDPGTFAKAMEHLPSVLSSISHRAEKYGIYVACGFLLYENGMLFNAGILWGPDGNEIGRVRKSNMWHFDAKYVNYGKNYTVWNTELGKVGMIICADGRVPEITRILALQGAEVVIDMANLVTSGKNPACLSNPQVEYMLPSRARENGIWFAMADKIGLEAGTVLNSGLSCIIDPFGKITVKASSDKEEILIGDVSPEIGSPAIPARRPELYGSIILPIEKLPVKKMISEALDQEREKIFASTVHFAYSSTEEYIEKSSSFVKVLEDQENRLIMLPTVMDDDIRPEYIRIKLQAAIGSDETILAFSCRSRNGLKHGAVIFTAAGVIGHFYKSHGNVDERLDSTLAPLKTPIGNVAVMFDQEGLVPEVARTFMLEGTEMLLWFDGTGEEDCQENFCRTRASENKIYVLYNSCKYGNIVAPSGLIKAVSLPGRDQSASAILFRPEARNKTVVPGTDVVLGRRPELYGLICRK